VLDEKTPGTVNQDRHTLHMYEVSLDPNSALGERRKFLPALHVFKSSSVFEFPFFFSFQNSTHPREKRKHF
jgi:hypothetical protein